MTIHIRQALLSDLDQITAIEGICFPPAEAASRGRLQERLATFSESFFVAELNGNIIGFINGALTNEVTINDDMFEKSSLHEPNGDYQSIFGLDVLPEYRKQGVAASLMNHMINVARNQGRKGLILTCKEKLIPYYSKFGYVNQGVSLSVHGGVTWYDMLLLF